MKNVKTLLILLSISTFIFASNQRVAALGGNAGYWADDYANITNFPASVNNHNVAWTDGTDFTSIWNSDGTTWGFRGGTGNEIANLMWGNGTMGVTFGLGMSAEVKADDDTMNCGDDMASTCVADAKTDINIGFGMPLAGMDFGFATNTTDHSINLRRAQDVWVWDNILVGLNINGETEEGADDGNMEFNCDFYTNRSYDSGASGLFALGFGYDNTGDGSLALNWTFGVESPMTDWATLRVGYQHSYDLMNQTGVDADDNGVVLGLGFNYGSFTLDMALNTEGNNHLFNDPVKYVTGRNDEALGAGWTISYNW